MPAHVRKPKDKALVEDAVKLTYARIYPKLKEEDRGSLEMLNQAIRSALEKHNNIILTGRSYARWEQFEDIEQSQLKPLPIVPFELHNRKMLTVQRNGHMRLLGMHAAFKASQENFTLDKMTNDEFTSWLITNEWDDRCNRTIKRLVKAAGFRYEASLEHIDYDVDRELDRNLIQRLADLGFMSEGRNLFIVGSTGTGKSYIATALGYRACQKGHRVLYANTARLMAQLKVAKAKGSILKELKKIERTELLILDDFGLRPLDTTARNLLMDIIEDRHGKKSTIIASQIPVRAWYEAIADQTVADAIMDRIIHGAIKIQLKGESMRKRKTKESEKSLAM